MPRNPILPKLSKKPIRWRAGPLKGTVGLPALPGEPEPSPACAPAYRKDPRGRKPKDRSLKPKPPVPSPDHAALARAEAPFFPNAGRLRNYQSTFFEDYNFFWGAVIDLAALVHGPVGCGQFVQTTRLTTSGRAQGIDGFTALHFCTDIQHKHLDSESDARLSKALDEIAELFPLAKGTLILSTDPMGLIKSDARSVATQKIKQDGKLVLPISSYDFFWGAGYNLERASVLQMALRHETEKDTTFTDVALTFGRKSSALVWIVHKLLADLGLNVIHEFTGASAAEITRVTRCKLVIGLAPMLDVPDTYNPHGHAKSLSQWFSIPLQWCCFHSPAATDASLRRVAARFDRRVQRKAEALIAANKKRVDRVIAHYRPKLEGKLLIHLSPLTEETLQPFRLLGMRIGDATGWDGKTGTWRTPRIVSNPENPSVKSIDALLGEAKPDLVLYGHKDEAEWFKRGYPTLRQTPMSSGQGIYWGYDGFELFAAELDRMINAPWRKLVTPPWRDAHM